MTLKDEIKKLVEVQAVDSRIYFLQNEKENEIPSQIENVKKNFEESKKILETVESRTKELQVKKKEKELDLATKEEGVKKAQGQLYQLKSNKEYQAKLTEIASFKADVSLLEEEVIKVLDEIEETEKKNKEAKAQLAEKEKIFKEGEAKLNARLKSIENEIKELEAKREALTQGINPNILNKYERLIKTRSGLAIVPVDIESENCGACHMRVTSQTINEIKMYKDLVLCESCVRILYIADDILT